MTQPMDKRPWYQHRWPWILISIPAASVVLGVILITTALKNPAILVVDNYYAEGRGINRSLALDEAAARLGLSATLRSENGQPRLQLRAPDAAQQQDALRLYVYHVTDDQLDNEFVFVPIPDTLWYEPISQQDALALQQIMNTDTSWYLEMRGADNDWRLRERISTPLQEVNF